ncbi:MAG: GDPmannose 4,6-dehydratase [Parcubacteria group bacterium Gr01-1014_13]|nr:MAG: GDPmannose 4,6-dehydratase [Parcubacteria group bacterium Gr01-1014_13]
MKKAIISGITGQDGSYLAELLLSKGYEVHGIMRRISSFASGRIDHLITSNPNIHIHYGDLTDALATAGLISDIKPDEFYNIGAMSQVKVSFEVPEYTLQTNAVGVLNVLEAIRKFSPQTKFYQASSSEMFGVPGVPAPYNENTPMMPQSPYGVAKLAAYHLTRQYRDGYGLFATTGILFNHESPRRGGTFVTKKITKAVARIKNGTQDSLVLGNLDAKRDWGWSPEFVEAIYLIMQQEKPDVFVVATGETHTIKEFVEEAFSYVGLNSEDYVKIDDKYKRPNEVPLLLGDPSKIKKLGWEPKMKFNEIVHAMMDYDLEHFNDNT